MPQIDLQDIISELKNINVRLSDSYKEMYKQATLLSHAERNYKIRQRQKILELKAAGHPVTLILELAKGDEDVARWRFERDLAQGRYEAAKESIRSLRTTASVYQSVLRVQDEI